MRNGIKRVEDGRFYPENAMVREVPRGGTMMSEDNAPFVFVRAA